MKPFKILLTAAVMLLSLASIAQNRTSKYIIQENTKGLNMGDDVPNLNIQSIRNYPTKIAQIGDFRGKLLILDFWSKYCSSCIAAFPKMERLQNEFGDKIQILLVGDDPEEELKLLFQRSPILKAVKLPMPLGDTILKKLFPHEGVPYHVWIGTDGKVIGMTDGSSTNSTNVKQYIETGKVDLGLRKAILSREILRAPLIEQLINYPEPEKYVEGGVFILKANPYIAYSGAEFSTIFNLIKSYFSIGSVTKYIAEVKDSTKYNTFFPPKNPDLLAKWQMENRYKIVISPLTPERKKLLAVQNDSEYIRKYLREYVLSHFGITYRVEDRMLRSLVLSKKGSIDRLKSKGLTKFKMANNDLNNTHSAYVSEQMNGVTFFRNSSIQGLVYKLTEEMSKKNGEKDAPVLFDESNIDRAFKLDADIRLSGDVDALNKQLDKYGLVIKEEMRSVKCLVVKEL